MSAIFDAIISYENVSELYISLWVTFIVTT